jgi:PAS domain S-box-containing protein
MEEIENKLRILMLEDTPSDAQLAERELHKAGIDFTALRVETRDAFIHAMEDFRPDIVLSDYQLPSFDGMSALQIVRRDYPDVPVIMVTGALSDIKAVELLHAGASDYILKDRLARLGAAVQRVLSMEQGIRARKHAQLTERIAREKYQALFLEARDGIVLIDETGSIVECNPEFERQTGRSLPELQQLKIWALHTKDKTALVEENFHKIWKDGKGGSDELAFVTPDGAILPIEFRASIVDIGEKRYLQSITRDVSMQKMRKAQMISLNRTLRMLSGCHSSLIHAGTEEALFTNICQNIVETGDYLLAWVSYPGEDFVPFPIAWMGDEALYQLHARLDADPVHRQNCLTIKALGEQCTQVCNNLSSGLQVLQAAGVAAILALPLLCDEVACGVLTIFSGNDYAFSEVEIKLLEALAEDLAFGIGSLRTRELRRVAEAELLRLNRSLKALSSGNHALVHAVDEKSLLQNMCRATTEAGYQLAWVGFTLNDEKKSLKPMAMYGQGREFIETLNISWANGEVDSPSGNAVRTGQAQIVNDIASNPIMKNWQKLTTEHGIGSIISLPLQQNEQNIGVLTIYATEVNAFGSDQVALLKEMADDLAFGIVMLRLRDEHEKQAQVLHQSLEESIQTIASTLEARDPYTAGHQRRVAELATAIARKMALPESQVQGIHLAATIHDLGKIHIPAEILSKPGKISELELLFMKTHPQAGYDILKNVTFPWPIAQIILQHHEKLNGSGYPQGLKGEQILLDARIVTVADVVEAMSSHRPYRSALGIETALNEINLGRGSLYDPQVVDACLSLFRSGEFRFGAQIL